MHELRSYVDPETAYDNNAYTITSTYHPNGLLTMYTSHPVESTNLKHQTENRTTEFNSYAMTGNQETFLQGAAAWRNGRDLTKDQRKELIVTANTKALNAESSDFGSATQSFVSLSSKELIQPESETSTDELALDINIRASSNHRTTAVGAQKTSQPKTPSNQYVKKNKSSQINKRSGTAITSSDALGPLH